MNHLKRSLLLLTIIAPLYCNAQSFTGEQEKIWNILKGYKIFGTKQSIDMIKSFSYEAFQHPLIKARLLEELQDHTFTQEEIDSWQNQPEDSRDSLRAYYTAKELIEKKKTTKDYQSLFDSLRAASRESDKAYGLNQLKRAFTQVPAIIILTCGRLDIQEAVPILQAALQDSVHYDIRTVKIALARLQIEPYHTEMIDLYSHRRKETQPQYKSSGLRQILYSNVSVLKYISSQESIAAMSELLTWPERIKFAPDLPLISRLSIIVPQGLYRFIQNEDFKANFSKEEQNSGISIFEVSDESLEKARQWLIANKGQYQFDRYDFRLVPLTVY